MWFNNYENRKDYFLKTAEGKMEGQDNFMAIIAKVDNPRLPQVIEEFEETISILFDPPEDMDSDGTVLTERGLIENRPH